MNRQLILARHSLPEMDMNVPARAWKLSGDGKVRAKRMAEDLIQYHPDKLFSSPEPKALETAEIISNSLHLPVSVIEDLHEHERSRVPYLSRSEFKAAVCDFFEKPDLPVFGDETANEAYARFSSAIFSALSESDQTPVFVSHGTVMSLFVSRWIGQPGFQIWSNLGLPGFFVLDMQSHGMIASEAIT